MNHPHSFYEAECPATCCVGSTHKAKPDRKENVLECTRPLATGIEIFKVLFLYEKECPASTLMLTGQID